MSTEYKKISPFGKRKSDGTFDDFFDTSKYSSLEESNTANDKVIVDFVQDEKNTILFMFYNTKNPEIKKYHTLNYQHFPFGVDVSDDNAACEIAASMF